MNARAPITPRLLAREDAAQYLGLECADSLRHVPVRPVKIGARVLYDLRRLDAWLDELGGLAPQSPPAGATPAPAPEDADAALQGWLTQRGPSEASRRS